MKKVPKTDNERRKKSDDKHRTLGRIARNKWLTLSEHEKVDAFIEQMRKAVLIKEVFKNGNAPATNRR